MQFFSNEIQQDDPDDIRLTSAQSVSRPVRFKEEFYSVITISFQPSKMSTKDTVEEQTFIKLVSGSLTKSKLVTVTTKDEQTPLLDTTSNKYNQIEDSSKPQVIRQKLNNTI
jgi:hypothetical protein